MRHSQMEIPLKSLVQTGVRCLFRRQNMFPRWMPPALPTGHFRSTLQAYRYVPTYLFLTEPTYSLCLLSMSFT